MRFDEMGLSPHVMKGVNAMGFETATPIQEQAIPLLMQGEDLIGQAQTGTGKTAAFGIPILERWIHARAERQLPFNPGMATPFALILAPTRELAIQIGVELDKMGSFTGIHSVPLYGGQEIEKQLRAFSRPVDVVVGTPGRLQDHLERQTLDLSHVRMVVLDEADRMLDMGFVDEVIRIMSLTPPTRQTMLFSATMPREVVNLAYEYSKSPQQIKVSEDRLTVENIRQTYILVDAPSRLAYLLGLLKTHAPKLALIFVRTKHGADKLGHILRDRGFSAETLHGNLTQRQRDRVMAEFREGKLNVLVATDLASRGLDVFDVSHVINYDLPEEPMTYVHRIGRTGRMGAQGQAISLVFEDQVGWLEDLKKITNSVLEPVSVEPDWSRPSGGSFGGGPSRERHPHGSGRPGGSHGGGHGRLGGGRGGDFGRRGEEGGRPGGRPFPSGSGRMGGGYGGGQGRRGEGGGRMGGARGGFSPDRASRGGSFGGRPGGAPGGGVSGMTMRKIKERARQPAKSDGETRGGHRYVGREQ